MTLRTGQIDTGSGNAIRTRIVDWCSAYRHPGSNDFRFTNVEVLVNPVHPRDPCRAIQVRADFAEGYQDNLQLQQDLLKMAEALRAEFQIVVDHLQISYNSANFSFLGPDGERIPPSSTVPAG